MEAVESRLNDMPTDIISKVLSFTSPRDAARSSAVSNNFRSASSSDNVWDRFLPADIDGILSRAVAPVEFSSKKEFFLRLCDPILIDGGNKSFALERSSGKKCLMLSARQLWITWGHDTRYWTFSSDYDSRFAEVAKLLLVWWLDLGGEISSTMLSPKTSYAAYLIFGLEENSVGFDSPVQEASIRVGAHVSEAKVLLQPGRLRISDEVIQTPCKRDDGWMEIEMGEFFNDDYDESVHMRFHQVQHMNVKLGLIVQGIELRPKI